VIPLEHKGVRRGVLYLESERLTPAVLAHQERVLRSVSLLGGRSLGAAMSHAQIVHDGERWRWLATLDEDFPT
jgi:hypothetical protein